MYVQEMPPRSARRSRQDNRSGYERSAPQNHENPPPQVTDRTAVRYLGDGDIPSV